MGRGKRRPAQSREIRLSDADGRSRVLPELALVALEEPELEEIALPQPPRSKSPAANARLRKQQKPELYCTDSRCLWMTGGGPCPKHGGPAWSNERQELANKRSRGQILPEELLRLTELSGRA